MNTKEVIQEHPIDQQLQKFNVTDAAIAEMKEKYMPLTVTGLSDKEGLKVVHDARMLVKGKRVEVEKVRKDLNADALSWQKKVNAEAKRITELMEPIESHLEAEEDKIEKEKERIQKGKERQEEERINARIANLISAGCMYDGRSYSLAHLTIDHLQIKLMDDQPFAEFMSAILIQKEQEEASNAEADRIKEEERQRLNAEREALDKAKKEQEEREEKFRKEQEDVLKAQDEHKAQLRVEQERIAKEAADLQEKKDNARIEQLAAIGLTDYIYKDQSFCLLGIAIGMVDIKTLPNDEWNTLLQQITPEIALQKQKEAERKAAELRKTQEEAAEKAKRDAEENAKREREAKEKTDREAKAEAERQEALRPDKEKLQDFAAGIIGVTIPQVTSEGAQQIVNDIRVMLGKIQTHTLNKIKTL